VSRRSECNRVAEDRWVPFVTTDAFVVIDIIGKPESDRDMHIDNDKSASVYRPFHFGRIWAIRISDADTTGVLKPL
jgi:hypothetical protein